MQSINRQAAGQRQIFFQLTEIGGQQQLHARVGQRPISGAERLLPLRCQLSDQCRLIDLHPLDALLGQQSKQFGINRQQLRQQAQRIGCVLALAQQQIGHRTD